MSALVDSDDEPWAEEEDSHVCAVLKGLDTTQNGGFKEYLASLIKLLTEGTTQHTQVDILWAACTDNVMMFKTISKEVDQIIIDLSIITE